MAPFHPVGQNPTLAIERDLDLIVAMDRLGFDEAWIGEHHSAGFEIIASPEVFIGVAAERTKHIKLGTGVSSLPYHNPLMLADRMVLLDHLTRGRVMLGCGPGQLTSDAHMLGIPADEQRPRMEQSLDAIMRLLRGETVTMHTDGFTLQDARLQLKPYSDPCFDVAVAASFSPTGPRGAGKHGIGMLSIAATAKQGMDLLAHHWKTWEEVALEHGHVADRSKWRLVGPMHLADTREQAERDVEYGIARVLPLLQAHPARRPGAGRHGGRDHRQQPRVRLRRHRHARGRDRQDRGADRGEQRRLRRVPALRPRLGPAGREAAQLRTLRAVRDAALHRPARRDRPRRSDWVIGSGTEFVDRAAHAIGKAIEDHAAEQQAKENPTIHP